MSRYAARAAENLARLRAEKPLVHNITNFVVMNYTANVLLAAGASPVMAHADNEVEEMVALADYRAAGATGLHFLGIVPADATSPFPEGTACSATVRLPPWTPPAAAGSP